MVPVNDLPLLGSKVGILYPLNVHRRLAIFNLISRRLVGQIREYNAIHAHIRRIIHNSLAKGSAIDILFMLSVRIHTAIFPNAHIKGLIGIVPQKSSLESGEFMNVIPKLLKVSVAVALGISVLAHNKRPQITAVCHNIHHPVHFGIHGADHIGNVFPRISRLILNIAGLIIFLDPAVHSRLVGFGAGFIA